MLCLPAVGLGCTGGPLRGLTTRGASCCPRGARLLRSCCHPECRPQPQGGDTLAGALVPLVSCPPGPRGCTCSCCFHPWTPLASPRPVLQRGASALSRVGLAPSGALLLPGGWSRSLQLPLPAAPGLACPLQSLGSQRGLLWAWRLLTCLITPLTTRPIHLPVPLPSVCF